MLKVIKQIRVNDEQLHILQQLKKDHFAQKDAIHADLFPTIKEALKQIRELSSNIALISGAIASFTIPVMNTPLIQIKILAYLSLILLFTTICYIVFHLSEIIPKEVNELIRQHTTYMNLYDKEIDKINSIIESGDISKLKHNNNETKNILFTLQALEIPKQVDRSLDYARSMLISALFLLVLSFIPFELYVDFFKINLLIIYFFNKII